MTRAARVVRRLDAWLLEPAPAERLAVLRILVGGFAVGYLALRFPSFWVLADGRGPFEGVGPLWWLTGPLPGPLVEGWLLGTAVLGVAFTIGLAVRWSGPGFAVGLLLASTYRSSWGQVLWIENLLVLQLLVVACSPSGDAWAVGSAAQSGRASGPSSAYGWPLRVAALVTVTTYVLAGVAKLRIGGLDWMVGDTLRNHIAYSAARLELLGETPSALGRAVVPLDGWLRPLAVLTVALELAAPIALLGGRLRTTWVLLTWLMHVGIAALMFVVFPFPLYGVAFACFYRLEALPPALREAARWRPGRSRAVTGGRRDPGGATTGAPT